MEEGIDGGRGEMGAGAEIRGVIRRKDAEPGPIAAHNDFIVCQPKSFGKKKLIMICWKAPRKADWI